MVYTTKDFSKISNGKPKKDGIYIASEARFVLKEIRNLEFTDFNPKAWFWTFKNNQWYRSDIKIYINPSRRVHYFGLNHKP